MISLVSIPKEYVVNPNSVSANDYVQLREDSPMYIANVQIGDFEACQTNNPAMCKFNFMSMSMTAKVSRGTLYISTGSKRKKGKWIEIAGKVDEINQELLSLVYLPQLDFYGKDRLRFTVSDHSSGDSNSVEYQGFGGEKFGTEWTCFQINPENDNPRLTGEEH